MFDNNVDCFERYFVNLCKHVQILNNGTHRSIVIDSCVLADDSMFVCTCNDEKTACEVFVREPPVTIVSGFEDVQVTDGEEAVFKVSFRPYSEKNIGTENTSILRIPGAFNKMLIFTQMLTKFDKSDVK